MGQDKAGDNEPRLLIYGCDSEKGSFFKEVKLPSGVKPIDAVEEVLNQCGLDEIEPPLVESDDLLPKISG